MALAALRRTSPAAALWILLAVSPCTGRTIPTDGSTIFTTRGAAPPAGAASAAVRPDLFTGAATAQIPLDLPPGTGGLTPALALRYSSAARGESWVGTGWSLALPAITRSLDRGVPRYDDGADDFELDGNRLVPESDTYVLPRRYYARRETFERIVYEADGSWTVTEPGGTRHRFGLTPESRIERPGDGAPFAWLLSEEEDVHGNVITVRYDRGDPGTAYPSEVRYTLRRSSSGALESLGGDASRDRIVRFPLELRPDPSRSFAAGFERVVTRRLRAVQVRVGSEPLRCWELGYAESADSGRSLLVQVAHYGSDAACEGQGAPTAPFVTRMTYRSNAGADPAATGWEGPAPIEWPAGLALIGAGGQDRGVRLADVDGDGRPDLLKAYAIPAPGQGVDGYARSPDSGIYRNTGTGFEAAPSAVLRLPAIAGQIGALTTSFAFDDGGNGRPLGLTAIDLDGDGRTDLAGGVRWLDYATGSTSSYGVGGLHRGLGNGFEAVSDYGELLTDDRWALARYGLIDFRWRWNGSTWSGDFQTGSLPGPARFADLTGDGLPELIIRSAEIHSRWSGSAPPFHPGSRSCSFAMSSYHFRNEGGLRFLRSAVSDFGVTSDVCGAAATLRLSIDFQPCDPFDPPCQRRLLHDEARSQRFLADGSYAHWSVHWELGNAEIDFNGDGLADAVSAAYDLVLGSESLAASLNTGAGAFLDAPAWRLPAHLYEIGATFARDLGVRFADVDGDGRLDVVQAVESGPRGAWLGRGDAGSGSSPGPWTANGAWALPASLSFVNSQGQDLGLRLVDLDADGMIDLVRSSRSGGELYRNRGRVPDLLETLTTPLGARTTWSYTPSTAFDHTASSAGPFEPPMSDGLPHLPQVLQLVTAIEVDGGDSGPSRTTFSYAGGFFDPASRELRGFRVVTAVRGDGRIDVVHFHQDEARAGLAWREDVFSPGDVPQRLRSVESRYTEDVDGPPFVTLLERRVETTHDDPASPRAVASSFRYDAFGNVTERIDFGEVASPAGEVLVDLDSGDTRTTVAEYAIDAGSSEHRIVDRVRRQRILSGAPGAQVLLRETRFFFDGDATGTAAPVRGLVTRRVDVRSAGASDGPATTYGYDEYGNLVWRRDPRSNAGQGGGTTLFGIDPQFHTFLVSTTNPLGHVSARSTATPAGCQAHPAAAGIVQEERGPNLAPGEPGLRRCLDAFGRVVRERAPFDLSETRFVHHDAPGAARTERYDRTSASGAERASEALLDGFGRTVATRSEGPEGRTVVTSRSFDALGRVVRETAPRFEDETEQATVTEYDVLDRPVRTALPGEGRVWRHVHGRSRVTVFDPEGAARTRTFDAFGNLVRVDESDGTATVYAWDGLDRLVEVRGAGGSRTAITYDLLGRRRSLVDPDTGTTQFVSYDDNGNLLARADARGATTWVYDDLDRPVLRTAGASQVRFGYDGAVRGKGLLETRSDDAGLLRIRSYDALGRVTADSQTVGGATLDFTTAFDPLGAASSRTFPDGRSLVFDRDARGYLTAIRSAGAGASVVAGDIAWDARERLVSWTTSNGVRSTSSFDSRTGRVDSLAVRQGATVLEDLAYGFDASDRVTFIDDRRPGGLARRSFDHDVRGRLVRASGPYGEGRSLAALHYAYDAEGNLVCKDAMEGVGCAGGIVMTHPATTGSRPVHAPATVGGLAAYYDAAGNRIALGEWTYDYDANGRLARVAKGGSVESVHGYDAAGRRTLWTDHAGARTISMRFVRGDFTWDATRGLGRIEVDLAGRPIASLVGPFAGAAPARMPVGALGRRRGATAHWALVAAAALGIALAVRTGAPRRSGLPLGRRAVAAATATAFSLLVLRPAIALPDGDLNEDGRLDAADALIAERIVLGLHAPSASEIARGDVAPIGRTHQTPFGVDEGDVVVLWRALRGHDVDGDGLAGPAERTAGTSPFLADSDDDGVSDGAEVAAGSDPLTRDTDGDGLDDGADPAPLAGVIYRHADHLGSTVLVTRSAGEGEALVQMRAVYRPYGATAGSPSPGRGFNGRQHDPATGLYDYGARWYDPATGSFLQPDPLVPDASRPASLNRYAYAEGGPVDRVDPSGHASVSFRIFAGTIGPRGFSGAGVDVALSFGAEGLLASADPWIAIAGAQVRLAGSFAGPSRFQAVLSSPYPETFSGASPRAAARAERARAAVAAGLAPIHLRALGVSSLAVGDILLTGHQSMASLLRFTDWDELQAGHAALVLDSRGELAQVLSAGIHGKYVAWNDNDAVGGRSWVVVRPRDAIDPERLAAHVRGLRLGDGALLGSDAYLARFGSNVCSSTVADALEAAGASPIVRRGGTLVTPADLRAFGPAIGRIDLPLVAGGLQ